MKLRILENETINNNLIVLKEKSLNRLVNDHHITGYVIMSACSELIRNNGNNVVRLENGELKDIETNEIISEDELLKGQKLSAENNKRNKNLISKLIEEKHYSFLPVLGGYRYLGTGNELYEKSIVIFPFDRNGNPVDINEVVRFCKEQAKIYNQEAILINIPNHKPYYWNYKTNEIDNAFSDNVVDWNINDLTKAFFTALKQYDTKKYTNYVGSPQRYTMTEVYLTSQPQTIMMAHSRSCTGELCMPEIAWNKD